MGRQYRTRAEALTVRTKAAELAAQVVSAQGFGEATIGARLWSMAVFFETYIASGAAEANANMKLLDDETGKPGFRVIAGGALRDVT